MIHSILKTPAGMKNAILMWLIPFSPNCKIFLLGELNDNCTVYSVVTEGSGVGGEKKENSIYPCGVVR